MSQLLRLMAWLLARLLLVVALCFVVLSAATHNTRQDPSSDRVEQLQRPLFFNRMPSDLVVRTKTLVNLLGRSNTAQARDELLRLGGASFPILLPELSALPPETRLRVAWALLPIARRMGWRGAEEVKDPGAAASFLERSWEERAPDFNPNVASRWVQRLAQKTSPGLQSSVVEYDSYALPALMSALPLVSTAEDVLVASHITQVAAHVTGLPWEVRSLDPPEQARSTVRRWQRWWQLHASDYLILRGPSRWSAMLTDTKFGGWLIMATTFRFGDTVAGKPIWEVLVPASRHSLWLLALATFGASGCLFVRKRYVSEGRVGRLLHRLSQGQALLASIPPIAIVAGLAAVFPKSQSHVWAYLGTLFVSAVAILSTSSAQASRDIIVESSSPSSATVRLREPESVGRWLVQQWQRAGHAWPFLLLLIFVIEQAFQVPGLSSLLISAFHQRDLHTLMAITTTTAFWLLLVVGFRRSSQHAHLAQEQSPFVERRSLSRRKLERTLPWAVASAGMTLALISSKAQTLGVMLGWTVLEIVLSLLLTLLIAALSVLAVGRRSTTFLDLAVSRCLEAIAAIPVVLSCAVAADVTGWWIPVAVAWVTGILNGLSCLRHVLHHPRPLAPYEAPRTVLAILRGRLQQSLKQATAVVVAQVVEIEAAIVFLGLAVSTRQGGLGQTLGTALTSGDPGALTAALLLAMGGTLLLRQAMRPLDQSRPSLPVGARNGGPPGSSPRQV